MNQNIKYIAKHYGFHHQLTKTVEECGEFIVALSKLANDEGSRADVVEEMADVMVMLQQMQYFLCIDLSELHKAIDVKVKRQIERMNQH
jgi:NTP pyrophosphatase (non-canonical NTP hydrolase)